MAYIKGVPREQIILFPDAIDDYIEEDNIGYLGRSYKITNSRQV